MTCQRFIRMDRNDMSPQHSANTLVINFKYLPTSWCIFKCVSKDIPGIQTTMFFIGKGSCFFFSSSHPLFDRLRGSAGSQAAGMSLRLIPARLGEDGEEVGLPHRPRHPRWPAAQASCWPAPAGRQPKRCQPSGGRYAAASGAAQGHWVPASSRRGRAAYEIRSLLRPPAANLKRDDHQATPGGGVQLWVHVAALTLLRCREGCSWD